MRSFYHFLEFFTNFSELSKKKEYEAEFCIYFNTFGVHFGVNLIQISIPIGNFPSIIYSIEPLSKHTISNIYS